MATAKVSRIAYEAVFGPFKSDAQKSAGYVRFGIGCECEDEFREAAMWYSKAILLNLRDSTHATALYRRAYYSVIRKDYEFALPDLNEAVTLHTKPQDLAQVLILRASVYSAMKSDALEAGDLARAISLDPQRGAEYNERLKELARLVPVAVPAPAPVSVSAGTKQNDEKSKGERTPSDMRCDHLFLIT